MKLSYIVAVSVLFTQSALAKFEAHEWGTFTSLVGSNGLTQHGMYHEDEKLPDFVHPFGEVQSPVVAPRPPLPCRNRKICFDDQFFVNNLITQKMETPVIYFYADQKTSVEVNVKFPQGLITETFPAPVFSTPNSKTLREARNGEATFKVDVLPELYNKLPDVEAGNIYGHARNVASNIVKAGREMEKFIFYRGLGRFQPDMEITSRSGALRMEVPLGLAKPKGIFLVDVDAAGNAQMTKLGLLKNTADVDSVDIGALQNHSSDLVKTSREILRGSAVREALIANLVQAGLYADEATAMINTWEHGYLKVPGLRILYILPRDEVERTLPLAMTPAPEKLERVFVGRIEVLLDTEEARILGRILDERDEFKGPSLGRFAEPMLRRVLEVYVSQENRQGRIPSGEVLQRLNRLISEAAKSDE